MGLTAFGEQQVAMLTPMAGWTFAYNVNGDLVASSTTGSGSITSASGFAVLSTTAATESTAKIETKLPVRYIPGQGALIRFAAIFTAGVAGSTQIIGVGDANDGFFFGYNGADFGVMRRSGGVDTWIAMADWSVDQTDWTGSIDFTKGNVFQIQFQWLGSGEIRFFIEDNATGGFELVHRIQYAGTATSTSVLNPTLPIMAEVSNSTNTTAVVLKTASAMGFCEGMVASPSPPHPLALRRVLTAADTGITTERNLITLSNQSTWQTKSNRIRAQMQTLSVATDGTKPAVIKLTRNTTLGGTPSYSDYNANTSAVQYDTAGTTLTGGTLLFAATMDKVDAQIFDLSREGIFLAPGEKITVSAQSALATDVTATVTWLDLL